MNEIQTNFWKTQKQTQIDEYTPLSLSFPTPLSPLPVERGTSASLGRGHVVVFLG